MPTTTTSSRRPRRALALFLLAFAPLALHPPTPVRAAPHSALLPYLSDRQSGPSQACTCANTTCRVDQTCYGRSGIGFCSTLSLGNPELDCTDVPDGVEDDPDTSLGSGILCLCPRPDCPLGERCLRVRSAGVCYRGKYVAVFEERQCVAPTASPSLSPTPYPSETASPATPSPSATPSLSVSPSVSGSPDSALANPASAGTQGTFTSVAASATATASADDAPAVCVDAAHLAHVPSHALVFAAHRHAHVLCDGRGSCATPGHMVVFRGSPMMMRTYCAFQADRACTPGRRLVNSPKFARAWRAGSHTEGLQFTALAARWATPVEEAALTLALRLGL